MNRRNGVILLAAAVAAAMNPRCSIAESNIFGYQFTGVTFKPTTVAANLAGSSFGYVNANPGLPGGPPFIVNGGILPDDPPFYVANADWFSAEDGANENYYDFSVSVVPGYALNVSVFSFEVNSRQEVPFLTQIEYSTSSSFASPVNFDNNAISIPTAEVWTTETASDNPISGGYGTYYFRVYNELDPDGNGSISDELNMGNFALIGTVPAANFATPMYWDPSNSGSPGSGGSGSWLGASTWADGAIDYPWSNTIPEIADFAGTGGTVNLGGNVTASGLSFLSSGYTITASSAQTLTLSGTISTTADATISAPITTIGSATLTKTGTGTLTIAGPANFSTGTSLNISAGTIAVVSGGSITADGATQNVGFNPGDSATLTVQGTGAFATDSDLILATQGGQGTLNVADSATVSANSLAVGQGVSGAGGTGTVNQTGGQITVSSVELAGGDPTSVATYNLDGGTLSATVVKGGSGTSTFNFNGGTLQTTADNSSLFTGVTTVQIQNGGAIIDNDGHNITLADPLTGASGSTGGLTVQGAGTLTLTQSNNFSGPVTLNGGTLVAASSSIDGTFLDVSAIDVNSGATLQLGNQSGQDNVLGQGSIPPPLYVNTGGTVTTFTGTAHNLGIVHLSGGILTGSATPESPYGDYTLNNTVYSDGVGVTSTISAAGGVNLNGNITFDISSATSQLDISANLSDGNSPGAVTVTGDGTLVLSGANAFTGGTSVNSGTLELESDTLASATAAVSSGGILQYDDPNPGRIYQTPITYSGTGTLLKTGEGMLVLGAYGTIDVAFSAGAVIDVEGGELFGSSSYGGNFTQNQASLNIASGAIFDAVEAGITGTMQIDALTGAGNLSGGYEYNNGGMSTLTIGIAGGSGTFSGAISDDSNAHLRIDKDGGGTETFSGANTYTGGTIVLDGALVIAASTALPSDGAAIVGNPLAQGPAATLQLAPGIGTATAVSLAIEPASTLDITNNAFIDNYGSSTDPAATIRGYLVSGFNAAGPKWQGTGITNSLAAEDPSKFSVGYADGNNTKDHANTGVPTGEVKIMYTVAGDANLSGSVDLSDLVIIASDFGMSGADWAEGDLNYDGNVDLSDLVIVASNFGGSLTSVAPADFSSSFAAEWQLAQAEARGADVSLPDPGAPGLIGLAAAGLLLRRRRAFTLP